MNKYAWLHKQFMNTDAGGGGGALLEVLDMDDGNSQTTTTNPDSIKTRLGDIQSAASMSDDDLNDPVPPAPKEKVEDPEPLEELGGKTQTQVLPDIDQTIAGKKKDVPAGKPGEEKPFDPEKADTEVDSAAPRAGSHPKTVDDFKKLKATTKSAIAYAKTRDAELATLKQQLEAGPKPEIIKAKDEEVAQLKARVDELEKYEFMVRPEASSYLKKEFDEKITKASDGIYGLLKAGGLKDEPGETEVNGQKIKTWSMNDIKAKGGPLKYAPYSWWAKNVFPGMDPLEAKKLDSQLMALHEAEESKRTAIESAPEKVKEIQAKMAQEGQQKSQEWLGAAKKRAEELQEQVPYGKIIPITEKMTKEEKAHAEEVNAFHAEAVKLFPTLLAPQTPQQAVDIASGFVNGLWIEKENIRMAGEMKALQAKLEAAETKLGLRKKAADTRPGTVVAPKDNPSKNAVAERIALMAGKRSAEEVMSEISGSNDE